MNIGQIEPFQGEIKILEMILKNDENQLEFSFKLYFKEKVYIMTFYNVSRLRVEDFSAPLEVHGFEIANHSQNGWEKDSKYEIRDYEDNRINFFCEHCTIQSADSKTGDGSVARQGTVL